MRLGILTGGGDCPGLNAVIRAAVIRTIRTYDGHALGFLDGWRGVFDNRVAELDLRAIAGILPRGGTILGTSRVDPFREPEGLDRVRDALRLHRLDGLLVCGGEGTLAASARLAAEGVPIVGIPKTIDNDVPGTDAAVGFDTALTTVVRAIGALHSTAESHDRVILVEVMGRTTGWLALCGAVAGGGDVAVCPEEPLSAREICDVIRQRQARGREFSIVVVAEGARFLPDPDGRTLEVSHRLDAFGRPRFGGVGEVLAERIEETIGIETRTVTLGYVQRGGMPSAVDRLLGTRMGVAAADLAVRREFGRMVSLQGTRLTSVPLDVVLQGPRVADRELVEVAKVFFG